MKVHWAHMVFVGICIFLFGYISNTPSQSDLEAERRHSLKPLMLNMRALDLPELPLERWYKCDACPNGEHIVDTVPQKRMPVVFDTILNDTITFRDSLSQPWRCGCCGMWRFDIDPTDTMVAVESDTLISPWVYPDTLGEVEP